MLNASDRVEFFLYALAAGLAFLLAVARRNRWQVGTRSLMFFTAFVALLLGWLRPDLSILLRAKWRLSVFLLWLSWPFLVSWIVASVAIGPPRRTARTRRIAFHRRRRGEAAYQERFFRDFSCVPYSLHVVVFYLFVDVVISGLVVCFAAGHPGGRHVFDGSTPFPAVYLSVNALLVVYVLMNVWSRFAGGRPRISIGMALELVVAATVAVKVLFMVVS